MKRETVAANYVLPFVSHLSPFSLSSSHGREVGLDGLWKCLQTKLSMIP